MSTYTKTTFIEGSVPGITAAELNKIGDGVASAHSELTAHEADYLYQTAGGTGTAITLTISETLVNGLPITFIASANNSGAATTINTKPLYKPGGTVAPTLIAGKAYTIWYNLADNCFFIKASAEGTATKAQVLAGVPFSNQDDTGLIGEMPEQGTQTATLEITGSAKPTKSIDSGHINASVITAQLSASLAPSIVSTAIVGGVQGTAKELKFVKLYASASAAGVLQISGLSFTPMCLSAYASVDNDDIRILPILGQGIAQSGHMYVSRGRNEGANLSTSYFAGGLTITDSLGNINGADFEINVIGY